MIFGCLAHHFLFRIFVWRLGLLRWGEDKFRTIQAAMRFLSDFVGILTCDYIKVTGSLTRACDSAWGGCSIFGHRFLFCLCLA